MGVRFFPGIATGNFEEYPTNPKTSEDFQSHFEYFTTYFPGIFFFPPPGISHPFVLRGGKRSVPSLSWTSLFLRFFVLMYAFLKVCQVKP